jgi:hypothetical protein
MIKRLFIDIETSPNLCYTWQIGYKVNINHENIVHERKIICVSWKWEHEKKIHAMEWESGCDKKVTRKIVDLFNEAAEVVAHNGNYFDIPYVNTRAIKHGYMIPSPFAKVDTCQIARRNFMFNSNRLDYLARFLFNDKKIDNGGFESWVKILNGCKKSLKKMVDYNKKDVVLLEKVYHKLKSYDAVRSHYGVTESRERWTCPQCGSEKVKKNKFKVTKGGLVRHEMKCNECGRYYDLTEAVFKNYAVAKA